MSAMSSGGGAAGLTEAQRSSLFLASRLALVVTAMTFAIRGDIIPALTEQFSLSNQEVGWIAGTAFWGFTLSIVLGGALVDVLGMRNFMFLALVGHVGGILVTIFAGGFWSLFAGTLLIGIANGSVEAFANPLVATIFPNSKTKMLNRFHVWFPGGIAIGGVVAYLMTTVNLGWQAKMAVMLLPAVVYGYMFLRLAFPATERVQAGISTGGMFREAVRPLFLVLVFCMLLTAATELGPNQWIPAILTETVGMAGILVLVWINGLMAVGRGFAGPLVHRISPIGVLIGSAAFSAVGLLALSFAGTAISAFLAATVFAVGICYFWPTMLGVVSERFPAGGSLVLGIMGGAGNLSVSLILPFMGGVYDTSGPAAALRTVVILPIILIFIFGFFYLRDRRSGGYKIVDLTATDRTDDAVAQAPGASQA